MSKRFVKIRKVPGKKLYEVKNHKKEFLGQIEFHIRWKKWVFDAVVGTFFDSTCLKQIAEKLETLDKSK